MTCKDEIGVGSKVRFVGSKSKKVFVVICRFTDLNEIEYVLLNGNKHVEEDRCHLSVSLNAVEFVKEVKK